MALLASLAACLGLLGPLSAQEEAPELAEVTVTVVDEDGKPAAGLPVYAMPVDEFDSQNPDGFATAITDEDGAVTLAVPANVPVRFDAPKSLTFLVATGQLAAMKADSIHSCELVLKQPQRPLVDLEFIDGRSGKPIPSVQATTSGTEFTYTINSGTGPEYYVSPGDTERTYTAGPAGTISAPIGVQADWLQAAKLSIVADGYVSANARLKSTARPEGEPIIVRLMPSDPVQVLVSDKRDDCTLQWSRKSSRRDLSSTDLVANANEWVPLIATDLENDVVVVRGIQHGDELRAVVSVGSRKVHTLHLRVDGAKILLDLWDKGRASVRLRTRSGRPIETLGSKFTVTADRVLNAKSPLNGRTKDYATVTSRLADEEGRWSTDSLVPDTYRLSVVGATDRRTFRGVHEAAKPVAVTISRAEPVAVVELTVVPDLVCRGELVDPDGDPWKGLIAGFAGRAARPFQSAEECRIAGPFETRPIPPGLITIAYRSRPRQGAIRLNGEPAATNLRTFVQAGARSLKIRVGDVVPVKGAVTDAAGGSSTRSTVILQDAKTGLQRYQKGAPSAHFAFEDAPAGEYVLWAFNDKGRFADPVRVETKEGEPMEEVKIPARKGARLTVDASMRDRHLRCDIKLPTGESLERILVGESPTITVPAGPIEIAIEEIDGTWNTTFALDLKPGESATHVAE